MTKYLLVFAFLCLASKIQSQNETCSYGTVTTNSNVCVECGKTDYVPNIRIVGGIVANPHSWPAQVLIIQTYKTDYHFGFNGWYTITESFQCAGTLINTRTILTAGHCINKEFSVKQFGQYWTIPINPNEYYRTFESTFTVYLGAHDISFLDDDINPSLPTVKMSVKNVIRHPLYIEDDHLNDIALLILDSPIQPNSYMKFACLPQPSVFELDFQQCYASGWGTLREGGNTPSVLYNVKLNLYNSKSCENVLPASNKNWDSQICAGDLNGGKDTCQGDSGGGLYVFDSNINKYVVIGVTSYGYGCGRPNFPGIYTRVAYFIDWIKSNWEDTVTVTTNKPLPTTTYDWNSAALHKTSLFSIILILFQLLITFF